MRVLIIEDDAATAQTMELMLKSEGFNVYTTDLGEEGVDLAKIYDYDLVTLDLGLPDIDGLEVLRRIRIGKVGTPIMIVSGRSDIETKVRAFGGGADDYLVKPFHKDELVARAQALVRRSKGHTHAIIQTGEIFVDLDEKTVDVGGRRVPLTGKEYQMLELLALRKGATITKTMFLNHLYGGMDEPEPKIVDVFVCKLRGKLKRAGADGHIRTVWGRGYVLSDIPEEGRVVKGGQPDSLVGRSLNLLSDYVGRTITDIADALGISPEQTRMLIKRLQELDYVRSINRNPVGYYISAVGLKEHEKRTANANLAVA